jgi:hypothetical protein
MIPGLSTSPQITNIPTGTAPGADTKLWSTTATWTICTMGTGTPLTMTTTTSTEPAPMKHQERALIL